MSRRNNDTEMHIRVANAPCSWGMFELTAGSAGPDGDQVMDEIEASGYAGTELGDWGFYPTDPPALEAALEKRGLSMIGGFVPVALARTDALDDGRALAVKTARLMAAVAPDAFVVLSDDCGKDPVRHAMAGRIREEQGLDAASWTVFGRAADEIARAVRDETGLRTVFHPHCAGYVETPREIARLLELTDPALVGLCLDTGHYRYGGGEDPVDAILLAGERLWHVHFKDCEPEVAATARREEVDFTEAIRRGVFCELGRGSVDFAAVVAELRRRNYGGWIVVEQDVLPGMGAPLESARRNREFLASLGL
jgi:inosose dehydratase